MYAAAEARMVTAIEIDCCIRSALLGEVYTTPKPGLVDCKDNGAHKDMDVALFETSTSAITPYISRMLFTGYMWKGTPENLFKEIRRVGIFAEKAMLQATEGVNTHKGMIFTMGILAAAAGKIYQKERYFHTDRIFDLVSEMTGDLLEKEFREMDRRTPVTHGEILYRNYRERGIRGEAQKGFPVIRNIALPLLMECRGAGLDENSTNIHVLLKIMTELNDTNVWTRGSFEEMKWLQKEAEKVLRAGGAFFENGRKKLRELNRICILKNLSPGGAADILGASLFLYHLSRLNDPDILER